MRSAVLRRSSAKAMLPDALILLGLGMAMLGLYLLVGLAWVLLTAGAILAGYGVAADLRWR